MKARDIISIVMGAPIFLLGLSLALYGLHSLLSLGAGVILLLISVGLIIPGKVYEHRAARAIGFVALSLATAASVTCVVIIGIGVGIYYVSNSDPGAWWAWGVLVLIGGGGLLALILALLCTWVLLRKLRPKPAHAAVGIAAGIAVGALNAVYSLCW